MRRIRVLSVDDYVPLREYLRAIFRMEDEIELVGEAENGAQAIEEARRLRPDVIIMDVDMPVLDGLEATRQILQEQPQAKVLFLVAEETWRTQAEAVGGSAFLLKDTPPDDLVAAILAQVPEPVAVPAAPVAPRWAQAWTVLRQRLSPLGRASSRVTAEAWASLRRWLVQEQWPRLKDLAFQRSFRLTLGLVTGLTALGLVIGLTAAGAMAWTVDPAALARQFTLGAVLSFISLTFGLFFFIYAARYYASVALILAIGGNGNGHNGNGNGNGYPNGNGLRRNGFVNGLRRRAANGLQNHNGNGNGSGNGNGNGFHLDRQPFVSIHLPTYNEQRVIDRLLTACTSFDYENYEVIVGDDSSDGTLGRLEEWAKHPKVKVSHRINRKGFKGAALKKTMEVMDPRTEFIVIYDADFVPAPNMIQQYLAYFYGPNGSNGNGNGNGRPNGVRGNGKPNGVRWNGGNGAPSENGGNSGLADERVAAVQGYQWHMLNADENWITKGVRAEYSGSYVVERSGQELVGTMKMISGSVYMIRVDALRQVGWGTSITEDWELTIKLYLAGYRVLYTPFIQAPAECVNNFKQLVKQRMRWAEGHTYQVKKYFRQVMTSPRLSLREKLEFLYYTPYYLQSVFFLVGTAFWLLSDTLLHDYFPYWRSLFGWSLVFTNFAALALMNLAGLFLERGVKRDIGGVVSVILLGYILAPFQAYAALKGLLENEEGGWNRTPKSGRITGALAKLQLARRLRSLLGARRPRRLATRHAAALDPDVAPSRGSPWSPRKRTFATYGLIGGMLAAIFIVVSASMRVPVADASASNDNVFYFSDDTVPSTYMMWQTFTAGSEVSATGTVVDFYSDTFSDTETQWVEAGVSEVCIVTSKTGGGQSITVELYGGTTLLGSGTITPGGAKNQVCSGTFSTNGYTFAAGETLHVVLTPTAKVTMWWGLTNEGTLTTATIVPENLVLFIAGGGALLLLAGLFRWKKQSRSRRQHGGRLRAQPGARRLAAKARA